MVSFQLVVMKCPTNSLSLQLSNNFNFFSTLGCSGTGRLFCTLAIGFMLAIDSQILYLLDLAVFVFEFLTKYDFMMIVVWLKFLGAPLWRFLFVLLVLVRTSVQKNVSSLNGHDS